MKPGLLISLIKRYGSPLYVYDGDLITTRYRELQGCFPKARVFYAMKANYNPHILALLRNEGAGIDAVSPGDVLLAKKIGFKKDDILFTANNITDEEIKLCRKEGVLFNIGSLSELERFGKMCEGSEICLRFNSDVIAGAHAFVRTGGLSSKFGIALKDVDKAMRIAKMHKLKVVGVHEHTGSGIPEQVKIVKGFRNLLKIIDEQRFPDLRFVDMGGGFKVPYHPTEKRNDYHRVGHEIERLIEQVSGRYGRPIILLIEPGRFIVAESGIFLVRVITVKRNALSVIVGTDGGFSQLIRPMLYGAYHHVSNLTNPKGKPKAYDITGNICETGDWFAKGRRIPEIREGDVLAIHTAGAYCYSMGSIYNLRPMPAEVIVQKGKAILSRKRLSPSELVNHIV